MLLSKQCTQSPSILPDQTRRTALVQLAAGLGCAMFGTAPSAARAAAAFPGATWPTGTPESVGLIRSKLLAAQAVATKYSGGAGCVIRHGKLVHSWGGFKQLYSINSATKSWGSVVLGFAVDDGRLSLGTKVQSILPNFGYRPTANTGKG